MQIDYRLRKCKNIVEGKEAVKDMWSENFALKSVLKNIQKRIGKTSKNKKSHINKF